MQRRWAMLESSGKIARLMWVEERREHPIGDDIMCMNPANAITREMISCPQPPTSGPMILLETYPVTSMEGRARNQERGRFDRIARISDALCAD
jgi:hypothetical protein